MQNHLDPDLPARSAVAYGYPVSVNAGRKRLSIGASSLHFASTGSTTTDDQGVPRQRYLKDLIRIGRFVHPTAGWAMDVTQDRLATWLSAFRKMRANGIDIEVTSGHDDSAEAIRGYAVDMYVEDGVLFGILEMRGKGIELAEVVKNVSVEIESNFIDGQGVQYGDSITAIAIGEKPVVSGQQPFERLAASLVA